MDDHPSTLSRESLSADVEPLLDSVTAELKAEFARLEHEERIERTIEELEELICSSVDDVRHHNLKRRLIIRADTLYSAIDKIDQYLTIFGQNSQLQRQKRIWVVAYKVTQKALAKLNALLARSLHATLSTPLLLDGPELSGYKHRLR